MKLFSHRKGLKKVKTEIQVDSIDEELRNLHACMHNMRVYIKVCARMAKVNMLYAPLGVDMPKSNLPMKNLIISEILVV
jgi:hypothetical protein